MTRKIKYLLCILICSNGLSYSVFAQTKKIDSLTSAIRNVATSVGPDSIRTEITLELAWELAYSDPDSSIRMVERESRSALTSGTQLTLGRCYHSLGWFHDVKSEYKASLEYYNKALLIWKELGKPKYEAATLGNMGSVYANIGDFPLALDYYLRSQRIYEEIHDEEEEAVGLGNIGLIYFEKKEYAKALAYYNKALSFFEKNKDLNGIQAMFGNIGAAYRELNEKEKALTNLTRALQISEKINNKVGIASNLGNFGLLYHYSDYEKAIRYYERALKISTELGDKSNVATWLVNMGEIETLKGDYAVAESHLLDALKMFRQVNDIDGEMEAEENISLLYEKMNKKEISLQHYKRFSHLKDTIFNSERERAITFREMAYEFDKKLSAINASHEKVMAVAEGQKKKQRLIITLVTLGFLIVALFLVFVIRSLRIARKQKDVIAHQKSIVEEKQKEILDSIRYARRIQKALLPSEWFLEKSLKTLKR